MFKKISILIISFSLIFFLPGCTKKAELSGEELHKKVIELRDQGIVAAKEKGDYRCCIHPACTMCYMESNKWNNFTAGTCACDDLIAKGEEPCPQCKRGLDALHSEENIFCDKDALIPTCNSINTNLTN